jgi:N-acyl-D-aspartate/D-glutamate deacylase
MTTADLVIRGGTVVDGTGGEAFEGDVGISAGRIVSVGGRIEGAETLDARGCVVAPGFIDIHTHYDAQVFWDPGLTPSCWHGVTTVVAGNCGFSLAPLRPDHRELMIETLQNVEDMFPATLRAGVDWDSFETFADYLDSVERRGVRINFGAYVGHTAVRLYVLGEDSWQRAATPEELAEMRHQVSDAVGAGAMGFATSSSPGHKGTGGNPVASRLGDLGELLTLVEPLRDQDRGVVAMLPGERIGFGDIYSVQSHAHRPLTWTPMLVMRNFPHQRYLEEVQAARRRGQDIWAQTAVRPIVFDEDLRNPFTLSRFASLGELTGAGEEVRLAAYRDPQWRARLREEVAASPTDWASVTVSRSPARPELEGKSVGSLSAERAVSPADVLLELSLEDGLDTRFSIPVANSDPGDVADLISADGVLLGLGDGGAHVGQLCDSCFPTTLLGTYWRERKALSLEKAVHKLTGEPAAFLGLVDRGRLADGYSADICVFDPDDVGSGPLRRVRDLPGGGERLLADSATGIRHVIVNGTPISSDGREVRPEARPGRVLRSAQGNGAGRR